MKYILVVGDGMAEHPLNQLDGKTPLQVTATPVADKLANRGELGMCCTVPADMPAGTDTAFVEIIGYDIHKDYTGRSPLEAAGMGIDLIPGHTAFRANLVAVQPGEDGRLRMVSHASGGLAQQEGTQIAEWLLAQPEYAALLNELGITIHLGDSFRHIASIGKHRTPEASFAALTLKPPHDIVGEPIDDWQPQGGQLAADIWRMMTASRPLLETCPVNLERARRGKPMANMFWLWGQGTRPAWQPWIDKFGKTGCMISAVPLVHGAGALAGLSSMKVEGATGELDTNYQGKAAATVRALQEGFDFALLHLEAPDECSHAGDLPGKLEAIRRLDAMLGDVVARMTAWGEPYRLLLISDHLTCIDTRTHDHGDVPFLLFDSTRDAGATDRTYDERCAASTGLRLPEGKLLMPRLFQL